MNLAFFSSFERSRFAQLFLLTTGGRFEGCPQNESSLTFSLLQQHLTPFIDSLVRISTVAAVYWRFCRICSGF